MKTHAIHRLRRRPLGGLLLIVLALSAPACLAGEAEPDTAPSSLEPGVLPRALPEGVPSLQMSTDYAHPALGFGTYAPVGQVQSRAIRVEPFNIRAGVQAGIGYNDNVALASTNKVGSMFVTVAPSVAVGLEGATQRYYLVYRGNYGAYSSDAQNDYTDHNIGLTAANAWTTRFRTLAGYEFTRAHTPRGVLTTARDASPRWSDHRVYGNATYGAAGAIGEVSGGMTHLSRRYNSVGANRTLEFDRTDLEGAFSYRLAPKTRTVVRARASDITHPGDLSLDSKEFLLQLGVTWEALAKTIGTANVGYMQKNFSSASRDDYSGLNYELSASWRPQVQTTLTTSFRRFLSETFEIGSSFLVDTVVAASWNQMWARSVQSTVNYSYGQVEHQGLDRLDTYQAAAARVSYPLTRSLRFGAEIRRDSRRSDIPGVDYSRNILLLIAETAL